MGMHYRFSKVLIHIELFEEIIVKGIIGRGKNIDRIRFCHFRGFRLDPEGGVVKARTPFKYVDRVQYFPALKGEVTSVANPVAFVDRGRGRGGPTIVMKMMHRHEIVVERIAEEIFMAGGVQRASDPPVLGESLLEVAEPAGQPALPRTSSIVLKAEVPAVQLTALTLLLLFPGVEGRLPVPLEGILVLILLLLGQPLVLEAGLGFPGRRWVGGGLVEPFKVLDARLEG